MPHFPELRGVLRERWFRRLYGTRLVSQAADGVFQASLAAAVLFSPEHQTSAKDVAAGFVVLLLPYSVVGPFAGVFIDRWRRRQILVWGNVVRVAFIGAAAGLLLARGPQAASFYAAALLTLSVNRFYLSALSAALPLVVRRSQLVTANSLSTTSGSIVTLAGGGAALAVRAVAGKGDEGSAVVALTAALVYLLSAAVAVTMGADLLGPQQGVRRVALGAEIGRVARDLGDGARHVWQARRAAYALGAISAHRFFYGISLIATLLVYRNHFRDGELLKAGLAGLGELFALATVGVIVGAVVTPPLTARIGKPAWIAVLYGAAAIVELAFGLPYTKESFLVAALLLGVVAQGSKVSVDTIVQEAVVDAFRGRVFAFYDTLFNLLFVLAAIVAAFAVPADGVSVPMLVAIAAGYAATAVGYAALTRRDDADHRVAVTAVERAFADPLRGRAR